MHARHSGKGGLVVPYELMRCCGTAKERTSRRGLRSAAGSFHRQITLAALEYCAVCNRKETGVSFSDIVRPNGNTPIKPLSDSAEPCCISVMSAPGETACSHRR